MRICCYCASSDKSDPQFRAAAFHLGEILATAGHAIVYGGGLAGSMGALADGALSKHGDVTGVIPRFMADLEWQHPGIGDMQVVEDMRERKRRLLTGSDAVVALPGGCGTLEELFEAITLKRLGLYLNPIILLNTLDYWDPLVAFLHKVIEQRFMNPEHAKLWSMAAAPEDVLSAIASAPKWEAADRKLAVVR